MSTTQVLQIATLDQIRLVIREELAAQKDIDETKSASDELMSFDDAARYLKITPTTLRKKTKNGEIQTHKRPNSRRVYLLKSEVLEYIRNSN